MKIELYQVEPPQFHAWTPDLAEVAARVGNFLCRSLDGVTVEHVGSTSIPECGGKGIIDLAVLYSPGALSMVREGIDAMGFQHQQAGHPFPEERPMRVGAVQHNGRTHRLHVHILAADSREAAELLSFRARLINDPDRRAAYVAFKQHILDKPINNPEEYTDRKAAFFDWYQ